jgi:hypothetical protein
MTLDQFRSTLRHDSAPLTLAPALKAMWEDAKENWSAAHSIAQTLEGETGSWIHAYLHRKEGDLGNASYWYRRARRPVADDSLEEEWTRIVLCVLGAGPAVLDNE